MQVYDSHENFFYMQLKSMRDLKESDRTQNAKAKKHDFALYHSLDNFGWSNISRNEI
jgi:hypothetical protein